MSCSTAGDLEMLHTNTISSSGQPSPVSCRPRIVRVLSPNGKRYVKPVHDIHARGFARSAQRRSSVLTLGPIERLQHFYAKRDLKLNKGGVLGFNKKVTEEADDMDQLPAPQAPKPSWMELNVETDLDVLLERCFNEIQHVLTVWSNAMRSGTVDSDKSVVSRSSLTVPLLEPITRMIDAVKNYTINRHDLTDDALSKLRKAALVLLGVVKDLEHGSRLEGASVKHKDNSHPPGLESEWRAVLDYLRTVETYALNPPHHLGSLPIGFSPEIRTLMAYKVSDTAAEEATQDTGKERPVYLRRQSGLPNWLERSCFIEDDMGRYYAMLVDNGLVDDEPSLPNPHEDEDAFLSYLADGKVLCRAFNNIVRRSRRPFGFITNIHTDTRRTFRAIENLCFFAGACKFRFELVFSPFDPAQVARKTDHGLAMLKTAVTAFCSHVIGELREHVETHKCKLALQPTTESELSDSMQEKPNLPLVTP